MHESCCGASTISTIKSLSVGSLNYSTTKKVSATLRERNSYSVPLTRSLGREFRKIVNSEINKLQRSGVLKLFSNRSGRIVKADVLVIKTITLRDIKKLIDNVLKYGSKISSRLGKKYLRRYKGAKWSLDKNENEAFLARKRAILSYSFEKHGKDLDDTIRSILSSASNETKRPSVSEIVSRIKKATLGISGVLGENVAKRMAVTEVASFQNYGAYNAYRIAKVARIKWVSVIDSRTRPSTRKVPRADHVVIDGRETTLGVPFSMPITNIPMLYPGDPSGSVNDIVNCRCTIFPVVVAAVR